MDIKSLMIGDWVQNSLGWKARVMSIKHTCVFKDEWEYLFKIGISKDTFQNNLSESDLSPIPLTPEVLEKNGFKMSDFFHVENKHQWSWWENAQTSIMLWCCNLDDDPKDGWMVRIEGKSITLCMRVSFLHDLQHAMRICGIEKEIEV